MGLHVCRRGQLRLDRRRIRAVEEPRVGELLEPGKGEGATEEGPQGQEGPTRHRGRPGGRPEAAPARHATGCCPGAAAPVVVIARWSSVRDKNHHPLAKGALPGCRPRRHQADRFRPLFSGTGNNSHDSSRHRRGPHGGRPGLTHFRRSRSRWDTAESALVLSAISPPQPILVIRVGQRSSSTPLLLPSTRGRRRSAIEWAAVLSRSEVGTTR